MIGSAVDASSLRTWLAARARATAALPVLEEALLGRRFLTYARHRLTGFALTRLAAVAVALLEYRVLASLFDGRHLITSLAVANSCQIAGAAAWGALEVLRTRVRALSRPDAAREISRWLLRAGALAALLVLASAAGLCAAPTAAGLYACACVVRLAADLVARTLYSGVYALARVRRPLASLLAAEVAALVVIALAAPHVGAWSFGAGLLVAVSLSRGLAVRYTLRAYRLRRLPRPSWALARARRPPHAAAAGSVLLAAAAGAGSRAASGLALVYLAAAARGDLTARGLALLLHVVGPVLVAATTWPQVFYSDLKRQPPAAAVLRARLERALVALGAGLAPILCAAALGAAGWAGLPLTAPIAAALAAALASQALLAPLQLAALVGGRYRAPPAAASSSRPASRRRSRRATPSPWHSSGPARWAPPRSSPSPARIARRPSRPPRGSPP
jgi:hypothetical protein